MNRGASVRIMTVHGRVVLRNSVLSLADAAPVFEGARGPYECMPNFDLLLERHVHTRDRHGRTPLHWAALNFNHIPPVEALIKKLLAAGADCAAVDDWVRALAVSKYSRF